MDIGSLFILLKIQKQSELTFCANSPPRHDDDNNFCYEWDPVLRWRGYNTEIYLPVAKRERQRQRREREKFFLITHPAFRTAPVQLNEAVPCAFALYGDAMILSPSSSSDIAVVKLIRSSSLICENMHVTQSMVDCHVGEWCVYARHVKRDRWWRERERKIGFVKNRDTS